MIDSRAVYQKFLKLEIPGPWLRVLLKSILKKEHLNPRLPLLIGAIQQCQLYTHVIFSVHSFWNQISDYCLSLSNIPMIVLFATLVASSSSARSKPSSSTLESTPLYKSIPKVPKVLTGWPLISYLEKIKSCLWEIYLAG